MCPAGHETESFCQSQCIYNGKYCCPDPEDDMDAGVSGADIVKENLRQLCVFQELNATGRPWLWWDYVTEFGNACTVSQNTFNDACAERVFLKTAKGISWQAVQDCIGDISSTTAVNPLLEREKLAQANDGRRGDISILPTIIANKVSAPPSVSHPSLRIRL